MRSNYILVCFLWVTGFANAGDIATERTQAATAVIITAIQEVTNSIAEMEQEIKDLEEIAGNSINIMEGIEGLPGVEDLFEILRDLETVIEAGEAMAHTYEGLEEFVEERFDTYEIYLDIIEDWGELDEEGMRAKFQQWNVTHMNTITNTLEAHGIHADQIDTAQERLEVLQTMSRSADGRMQAIQIGQEIATEEIKQLHQLKEIIMEQSNLHASYFAVKQAMESEQEAANTWIQREINPTIVGNEEGLPLP